MVLPKTLTKWNHSDSQHRIKNTNKKVNLSLEDGHEMKPIVIFFRRLSQILFTSNKV